MTPDPVTVSRCRADLSLCYPLMWNVTLEYTATHFIVLGQTRLGNPSLISLVPHTPVNAQLYDTDMVVVSRKLCRKYRTNRVLNAEPVVCESITLFACPQLLPGIRQKGDKLGLTTRLSYTNVRKNITHFIYDQRCSHSKATVAQKHVSLMSHILKKLIC